MEKNIMDYPINSMAGAPGLAGYPANVNDIDNMMHELAAERQRMISDGVTKPMDAKDEQLVNLAHEAGTMTALYRTERERRERAVAKLDEVTEKLRDLEGIQKVADQWRIRAEAAEGTLKRSRAARRR